MEPGTLTRVLSDFLTTVEGELSLYKGQHFLVYSIIDKHWCYGECNGRTGKFPSSHLHRVEIPRSDDSESLFVSIAAFPGQQDGDLSFSQGEIILALQEVESGWYLGRIGTRKGIFPSTHTWQLNSMLIKKAAEKKTVRRKAKVKTSLKAQLDGELDLTEGDILTVVEILEDGWCRGITENGREGTFPEGFISYINDAADTASPTMNNNTNSRATSYRGLEYSSSVDEPAPSYYDLFPEFCAPPTENTVNNNVSSLDVKPYAITLYPFNAQFPNELSFGAGEVVHLNKHFDSEWIEGTIDDEKGIFPASYVNIIVDCTETQVDQNLEENSTDYDTLTPGTKARVEYTFKAQMDGDLSIVEGDTVTIVEMANKDWVNVEDQSGKFGLCPRGYLRSLPEEPADAFSDVLGDFVVVVVRNDRPKSEEQPTKRLSAPHRPAPPAPAPGRIPLQKEIDDTFPQDNTERVERADKKSRTEDVRQKRADQRQNVISELVLTEKEYVRDLKLTYETFNLHDPSILESRGIDVAVLFGNIFDVIEVAEELLDLILRAMKGREEEAQTVGPCFTKMAEKLQSVYVKYCGNHEGALALLKKYESNEEIMTVFNKGIETLRHQIACFDMSSILIKPVQRILKYPLILYELVKCTDDDHPDKAAIEEAWKVMTHVASYINEYKRRKDLVSKYLDNDNTLMRKMAKLSMHSVAKMSSRLSTRLSASLGLTNVSVDHEFEELERQFRSVEKCTWQLAKDVEQCLAYLNVEAISGEVISDFLIQYYQGTPNVEATRLRDIRSMIWSQFMQESKSCLERRVNAPIHFLMTLLEGPAVLITKRHDKLLDYDAAVSRGEKYRESRIVQEELSTTKGNFEALSEQLTEELPILIEAATKILVKCIEAFAHARKLLCGKITKRYLTLCETSAQLSPQDVLESFLVNHNLLWNQVTRFAFAGSNPRAEDARSSDWCPQSEKQRIVLRAKYPRDRLYMVSENVTSTSSLDMGAARGTLVAIIKKQDPMGDTSRWYVDNGVAQGFLPAQKLWQRSSHDDHDDDDDDDAAAGEVPTNDLISMDSPEKETKAESYSQELPYSNELCKESKKSRNEFYYAMYDFAGNMPGTLTIVKGQALRLVTPHDEKGNDAWWLVEDRHGKKGYVPQNYLSEPPK